MPQHVVAQHSTQFNCCGQYFIFGSAGYALDSCPDLYVVFVCENLSEFCDKMFCGFDVDFLLLVEQPANTCNAFCKINHWERFSFHIDQHKLIGEISTR